MRSRPLSVGILFALARSFRLGWIKLEAFLHELGIYPIPGFGRWRVSGSHGSRQLAELPQIAHPLTWHAY